MWILPSKLSSDFAAASGCLKRPLDSASGTSACDPVLHCAVSGKVTPQPASWRGWKSRAWSRPLFGAAISPGLTSRRFVAWWTCSVLACPASPTVAPANSKGSATSGATATATGRSRTPCESWPSVAPPWCSLRMSLPGFQEDGFDLSERNYADWVTRSKARSLSLRKRLARAIDGSGCLSWPTPRGQEDNCSAEATDARAERARAKYEAGEYGDNSGPPSMNSLNYVTQKWPTPAAHDDQKTPEAHLAMKQRMGERDGTGANRTAITSLNVLTQLWASPQAATGGSTSRGGDRIDEPLLGGQVKLWTTPQAHDQHGAASESSKAKRRDKAGCRDLGSDVSTWATPNAHERAQTPREVDHGIQLANQIENWPTPNARDHKGTDLESRSGGTSLGHAAQTGEFSHRDREPTGEPSKNTSGRRLNPAFVCWLMGAPWYWTRAEPINCGAEATASWRSVLRSRLSSLLPAS